MRVILSSFQPALRASRMASSKARLLVAKATAVSTSCCPMRSFTGRGSVADRTYVRKEGAAWPLACSRLLWAVGCNAITQHDAAASVRAGFAGHELSALWPGDDGWILTEKPAGLFSHVFVARRRR